MLQSQFLRFMDGLGFTDFREHKIAGYTGHIMTNICKSISDEVNNSCSKALAEEVEKNENDNTVDIITDARHSTRKNSKFTDVPVLGYITNKVIDYEIVTRNDDTCAQRHELFGTKIIYNKLKTKGIKIRRHVHDKNPSINKYIRTEQPNTKNQNDVWHMLCSVEKKMSKVTNGPKKT